MQFTNKAYKNTLIFCLVLFIMPILVFLFSTAIKIKEVNFYKNSPTTSAVVSYYDRSSYGKSNVSKTRVLVDYEIDGQIYRNVKPTYMKGFSEGNSVGSKITIRYSPDNKYVIAVGNYGMANAIAMMIPLAFMLLIFILAAIGFGYISIKGIRKNKYLVNNGVRAYAVIIKIKEDAAKNKKHTAGVLYFKVINPITGEEEKNCSKRVKHTEICNVGMELEAYFNPDKSDEFYIDIETYC